MSRYVIEHSIMDNNWTKFDFRKGAAQSPKMVSTHAGIIPDIVADSQELSALPRMGIFADEMAQNIITRVVNYKLDAVVLDGTESPTMIRNLRKTIVPDLRKAVKFVKVIHKHESEDEELRKRYEECTDFLIFE